MRGGWYVVIWSTSLDSFQRIPLFSLSVSFTMKFYIHDGKWKEHTNTCQEKNILMVLLYSVLANSNGSCSLTADIISSI